MGRIRCIFALSLASAIIVQPALAAVTLAPGQAPSLSQRLEADPLTRELIEIVNDFAARGASADPVELRAVIQRRDSEAFAGLLGFTVEQLNAVNAHLGEIRAGLLAQYPELVGIAAELSRGGCGLGASLDSCGGVEFPPISSAAVVMSQATCDWIPYTAALIICTALGPWLYWPCAIVAMCEFCEGGSVERICGRNE